MKSVHTARRGLLFLTLFLMTAMLFTAAVSAVGMPGGREGAASGEAGMTDPMMGSDMFGDTEGNLGDTAPGADSWIGEGDGMIDGTSDEMGMGTQDDTLLPGDDSGNDSGADTATDTAGTSSGNEEEGGMSVFGIVITIVIILAVAGLIIALIPKKKSM